MPDIDDIEDGEIGSSVRAKINASFTKLNGISDGGEPNPTPAEILASLITVDGAGSGLDADLLDGNHAAAFATAAQGATADTALQPGAIGVTVQAYDSVLAATTASFTTADEAKLDGIEALADVTDATNVTAAGALMDSELADIAAVKALDQGVATTDSPTFAGATVNGNITVTGTVDGRDVAADGIILDALNSGIIPVTHSGGNGTAVTLAANASRVMVFTDGNLADDATYTFTPGTDTVTPVGTWPTGTDNIVIYALTGLDAFSLDFDTIPTGSAGSPSLAHTGDPDTGRYSPGANALAWATGGTKRLHLTSTEYTVDVPVEGTAVTQTATDTTAGRLLKVGDYGAGGAAGTVLFGRANILGTVSQSAGVPTGGVIEQGSNSNGNYVRFADGTQICWHSTSVTQAISIGLLGGFRDVGQTWIFPIAFISAPVASGNPQALTSFSVTIPTTTPTASSVFHTAIASQASATLEADLIAIGRWFT